jgi:hypothetical protein
MAYKDILVYLDPSADASDRLRLAVDLAKAHGARLIGVDASDESAPPSNRLSKRRASTANISAPTPTRRSAATSFIAST